MAVLRNIQSLVPGRAFSEAIKFELPLRFVAQPASETATLDPTIPFKASRRLNFREEFTVDGPYRRSMDSSALLRSSV